MAPGRNSAAAAIPRVCASPPRGPRRMVRPVGLDSWERVQMIGERAVAAIGEDVRQPVSVWKSISCVQAASQRQRLVVRWIVSRWLLWQKCDIAGATDAFKLKSLRSAILRVFGVGSTREKQSLQNIPEIHCVIFLHDPHCPGVKPCRQFLCLVFRSAPQFSLESVNRIIDISK